MWEASVLSSQIDIIDSCSLICSKDHKALLCTTRASVAISEKASEPVQSRNGISSDVNRSHAPISPDRILQNTEIKSLISENPQLRAQLQHIYQQTIKPLGTNGDNPAPSTNQDSEQRSLARFGHEGIRSQRQWTPAKGFNSGLVCLRELVDSGSNETENLKAFSTAVLALCPPPADVGGEILGGKV